MARKKRIRVGAPGVKPLVPVVAARSLVVLWLVGAALAALVVAVFFQLRTAGFINLDDPGYVETNAFVNTGLSWANLTWAWTTGHAANWHPLTWMSHMLDADLFGLWAGGHHLVSVGLHAVNTILLFVLLWRTTGAVGRSAFVAALFGVHPMHVESVAWVSERKDVLSTLFWLLTMLAYAGWVRRPVWTRYLLVCVCLAVGLTSKPMLVSLPIVLVLFDVWPLGRWSGDWRGLIALIREKVPLIALAVASSVITVLVQRQGGAMTGLGLLPLSTRLENAAVAYGRYVGKLFWPTNMAVFYPYSEHLPLWLVLSCAAGLVLATFLAWRSLKRGSPIGMGWFWFAITLVPVIGVVQVGTQAIADRYTYVPYVGLFIAIAWGVPALVSAPFVSKRVVMPAVAVALVTACALLARAQTGVWQSNASLWSHALAVTSDNYIAMNEVGMALGRQGRYDEALAHFEASSRAKPEYVEVRNNLGIEYMRRGRAADAIGQYSVAVRLMPTFVEARHNLAQALVAVGKADEAVQQYREVIRLKPDYAQAHADLGFVLAARNDVTEAISHFETAVRLQPDDERGHLFLALALAGTGRFEEAMVHAKEALRVNPSSPGARDAIARLQKALAAKALR